MDREALLAIVAVAGLFVTAIRTSAQIGRLAGAMTRGFEDIGKELGECKAAHSRDVEANREEHVHIENEWVHVRTCDAQMAGVRQELQQIRDALGKLERTVEDLPRRICNGNGHKPGAT